MRNRYRIVQPYEADVEIFEGAAREVITGEAVLWETDDSRIYPADVIDDFLLEAPDQPFERDGRRIRPADVLKVKKERASKFGKSTLRLGWATVFERAPSEFREVHNSTG